MSIKPKKTAKRKKKPSSFGRKKKPVYTQEDFLKFEQEILFQKMKKRNDISFDLTKKSQKVYEDTIDIAKMGNKKDFFLGKELLIVPDSNENSQIEEVPLMNMKRVKED